MKTTAKDWDATRAAFATSLMADTPLSSLAQNLDGPDWPIQSPDETPAAYLVLPLDELRELLALKGQPPERADDLVAILRDTLAFDAPFGAMVQQSDAAAELDNPLLKNLAKLGIAADFPVALTALDADTREFCAREKLATLGEFAVFAQSIAQTVIVGGDFRRLLNALSHIDEAEIARLAPFRPGAKGLHLAEALAFAVRSPAPRVAEILAYFAAEHAALQKDLAAGGELARHLAPLGDAALERRVADLLRPHLPAAAPASKKSGWLARLFGRK